MGRTPELSTSEEFAHLPEWDRYFWLSRAYTEASCTLCESMVAGDFTAQYSSSRVILHLMRQGIELFLKGAIFRATGKRPSQTHNLAILVADYSREYPGPLFHFEVPERFQTNPSLDLFPEIALEEHATLDQRHRYPSDRKGRSFLAPEIFDPSQVFEEVDTLSGTLSAIEWAHIRPLPVHGA
jgi:hypothetical protein